MKVKVLRQFKDKRTGVVHKKGDFLTITEERFKEIMRVGQFVYKIPEPFKNVSGDDVTNTTKADEKPAETASVPSEDGFDAMSVAQLREYADKAYKLTFGRGTKKAEMIETLRKMEQDK